MNQQEFAQTLLKESYEEKKNADTKQLSYIQELQQLANQQNIQNKNSYYQHPCPSCGHCPTCGRSNRWGTPYFTHEWRPYDGPFYVTNPNYTVYSTGNTI